MKPKKRTFTFWASRDDGDGEPGVVFLTQNKPWHYEIGWTEAENELCGKDRAFHNLGMGVEPIVEVFRRRMGFVPDEGTTARVRVTETVERLGVTKAPKGKEG